VNSTIWRESGETARLYLMTDVKCHPERRKMILQNKNVILSESKEL